MRFHENEAILDRRVNCLMPAIPIFQKHCFFKKILQILENSKFFLHFLLQFYRAFQWYIVCFHTRSGLGCTDQNVKLKNCLCLDICPPVHRGRNRSISFQNAMKTPPGSPRVSKFQEFFIELEYVEFYCDHPLKNDLEAKNH